MHAVAAAFVRAGFAVSAVGLVARVSGVVLVDLRGDLVPKFRAVRVAGSGVEFCEGVQRRHVYSFSFAYVDVFADRGARLGKLMDPLGPLPAFVVDVVGVSDGIFDVAGTVIYRGSSMVEVRFGDAAFAFRGDDVRGVVAAVKDTVVTVERCLCLVAVVDDAVVAVDGFGMRAFRGRDRHRGAPRCVVVGVDASGEVVCGFEEPADFIRRQRLTLAFDRGDRLRVEFVAPYVGGAVDPVL